MSGEMKIITYIAALMVAAVVNVVVETATGHHPGIGTGTALGVLFVNLWPRAFGLGRSKGTPS